MPNIKTYLSTLALVIASSVALTGQASAQSETQEEEAPVDRGFNLGEEADTTPQPGDTYVKEEFGAWSLRCIVVPEGDDPCQMYQMLLEPGGSPLAEYTMFRLPEGGQAAAGATIVVPLETSLQAELSIQVDDGATKRYPFAFCNTVGCYARIGLTPEDINAYKAGGAATITIVPIAAQDQTVAVELSLEGFTAAFGAASVLQQ